MSVFNRFHPRLQRAIVDRLGWRELRPVQEQAAEVLLEGMNAVVLAPTAGGKTEAALFPIISLLLARTSTMPGALYIAPIKALLNNQEDRIAQYAEMVGLRAFKWHGDTTQVARKNWLRDPGEILLTTPESLEVLLVSPRVPTRELFAQVDHVIVDEVHAFAGTDRGAHLAAVLERLAALTGRDLQRIGLSATVGNPEGILAWLAGSSRRGGRVVTPAAPPPRRDVLVVAPGTIPVIARDAARLGKGIKTLCFAESRAATEAVAGAMAGRGIEVFVHHSSVSREERTRAEEQFSRGQNMCIVCTSTLELGIDIGDLDRILQVNAPRSVANLLQRIGRTGRRAGRAQTMVFLCESGMDALQAAALLCLVQKGWVESVLAPDRLWHVLVHQVLAWTLQHGTLDVEAAWTVLSRVHAFRGFERSEFDALVAYLLQTRMLDRVGGSLVLGTAAERRFGRRNFLDLYSVFSSPQVFTVRTTSGRELGVLDEEFADQLVEEMSSFLLGGIPWTVSRIDRTARAILVEPAPTGRRPSWNGYSPVMLSFELCQEMKRILVEATDLLFLHSTAIQAIQQVRDDIGSTLVDCGGIGFSDDEIRWYTFAGGRINQTLRLAVNYLEGWTASADNVGLTVRGAGLSVLRLRALLPTLANPSWWSQPETREAISLRLPGYRISKFQGLLPVEAQREVVADSLISGKAVCAFLNGVEMVTGCQGGEVG